MTQTGPVPAQGTMVPWSRDAREAGGRVPGLLDGSGLRLALDQGLYAYDAYTRVLARSRRAPLLTLDQQLRAAAERSRVALVEF